MMSPLLLLSLLLTGARAEETPEPPATLLSAAAVKNNADEIRRFLDEGHDPNGKTSDGESVLHLACIWGGAKKAKMLLAAGADPNYRASQKKSSLDMTPLSWCSYAGYSDTIAEFLSDDRTNVNMIVKQEDGKCITAMDIAIKIGAERGTITQDILREAGAVPYEELKFLSSTELEYLLPPSGCP